MLIFALLLCIVSAEKYPTPFRDWQKGYFSGNPVYSPIGPFTNYSLTFRPNDGQTNPTNFLMVETPPTCFGNTVIAQSYQQWTIFGDEITYCGLLTQDGGITYQMTRPQFVYQDQLSSQFEVYFCADPRGGGCDTFWWEWTYNNETKQLRWSNRVGGIPHELTLFDFYPDIHPDTIAVNTLDRDICSFILGVQAPYDYGWITQPYNETKSKLEMLTNENRKLYQKYKEYNN
eukprot:256270_1